MSKETNKKEMNIIIITSLLTEDDEKELNDNIDINFSIISTSNFSKEDVIKFLIEVSEKLPITVVCALLKDALMKILKKKIKPEPNKMSLTIKKTENKEIYTFVSDFPMSEESIDKVVDNIFSQVNSKNK